MITIRKQWITIALRDDLISLFDYPFSRNRKQQRHTELPMVMHSNVVFRETLIYTVDVAT
jgi:hypothetical protein